MILDAHVHSFREKPAPGQLLEKLRLGGVDGCCVFSAPPMEHSKSTGVASFEQRLENVLAWTQDSPDRLFPVLWVHPEEKDILRNLKKAEDAGILAFKMICNSYYIGEKKPLRLVQEIAEMGKPILFHSGILWDGNVSSSYNRPLSFECLLKVKNLRFSMGHCSWPWVDECIAMYGKFLNAYTEAPDSAEMFFDITPGTPVIYREDLLTKIFTVGYDVPDNILFGTDCRTDNYQSSWASQWIARDNAIYEKLGVDQALKDKIYGENLLRFLDISGKEVTHLSPSPDNANAWHPGMKK